MEAGRKVEKQNIKSSTQLSYLSVLLTKHAPMKQKIYIQSSCISLLFLGIILGYSCSRSNIMDINEGEGRILRISGFDLRNEGVQWGASLNPDSGPQSGKDNDMEIKFTRDEKGIGFYLINRSSTSFHTITLIPNRAYKLTMVIKPSFERVVERGTREVNIGLRTYDGGGKNVIDNLTGVPVNKSDDWIRYEWEFTTGHSVASGRLHINTYRFSGDEHIKIADIALIELPPKELIPYKKGEGVTFRGGPGKLPMRIEQSTLVDGKIMVQTTGALYTFDLVKSTVTTRQLIGQERDLARWTSSVPLTGLQILKETPLECVLSNDFITFGVQCDGLIMVSPHQDIALACRSLIGGEWNRLADGHLIARDKSGGFAVNPDIPLGTGRLARLDANVRTGRVKGGDLDFSGYVDNKTFLSSAKPGWEVKWYISPGERLGISVFPPRPYPWKESFESSYAISNTNVTPEMYKEWAEKYFCKHVIMWNFFQRGWGGSFTTDFPVYDEKEFISHIEMIKSLGMTPCPYMSPYFYRSRDPELFASELAKAKKKYGIRGVYYDGIPSQEWVDAYEMMRMTREVLADGIIIFHNSGHASNGIPPLGEVSLKIPAVETYADITYGGELVWGHGAEWTYPEYIQSQYGLANCIGTHKAGDWEGVLPYQRDLILLKYNGRASLMNQDRESIPSPERLEMMGKYYYPVLQGLKKVWLKYGNDPEFYSKYYLPEFNRLTKGLL
jgi:hypothetical protein